MAYDDSLAAEVRALLNGEAAYAEKRMFGGIAFLLHGHMACGVLADRLVVRVGPDACQSALARPHVEPFDVTGRPMTGWVQVAPAGWLAEGALADWVGRGRALALSLPPKQG